MFGVEERPDSFPPKCPNCKMYQMAWQEDSAYRLIYGHCGNCHVMFISVREPGIYPMSPSALELAFRSVAMPDEKPTDTIRWSLWSPVMIEAILIAASGYIPSDKEEEVDDYLRKKGTDPRREERDQGEGETG